jgi:hypothetical protein
MRNLSKRNEKRRLALKDIQVTVFVLMSLSKDPQVIPRVKENAYIMLRYLTGCDLSIRYSLRGLYRADRQSLDQRKTYARHVYFKILRCPKTVYRRSHRILENWG